MNGVIFAGFYLDGKNFTILLNDEIQFTSFLTVVVVGCEPMRHQLLCYGIFVNRAEIDIGLVLNDAQLDSFCLLRSQQTYIGLE